MSFSEAAPAKVNLFLHAGDRRIDGFHLLQSLVVFTDLGDRLGGEIAPALSLGIVGPFAEGLGGENDNLVLRAAKALQASSSLTAGASLILTKNLPVASGIGGGSADAAAALRLLAKLWGVSPQDSALTDIAALLGSDVPVCFEGAPSFMEGRGEIIRSIASLPRLSVLLVNPSIAVPTQRVFEGLQARSGTAMTLPLGGFADTADLLRFLETTRNDLEAPARSLQPVIGTVLAALTALPGALLARMSGSGATCFGLFPDDESCARAADMLRRAHPGWWIAPTFVPEIGIERNSKGRDIGPTDLGI